MIVRVYAQVAILGLDRKAHSVSEMNMPFEIMGSIKRLLDLGGCERFFDEADRGERQGLLHDLVVHRTAHEKRRHLMIHAKMTSRLQPAGALGQSQIDDGEVDG